MAVTRIAAVCFTAARGQALSQFYREAFGFREVGRREQRHGVAWERLLGLNSGDAEVIVLRLGRQTLELVSFAKPGLPYPADVYADDLRFQHIAIVVADMSAAYQRLARIGGWSPITRSGPEQLPVSSGGVSAFKFRDPEGHPLELLAFSQNRLPAEQRGRAQAGGGLCLGIDHSAITVASTASSVAFYQRLGFSIGAQTLNRGAEQARLDDLSEPTVEVTALVPAVAITRPESQPLTSPAAPHLELLCYRNSAVSKAQPPLHSNDVAATRLLLETDDQSTLTACLTTAKAELISDGVVQLPGGAAATLIRDPDGHALLLRWPPAPDGASV